MFINHSLFYSRKHFTIHAHTHIYFVETHRTSEASTENVPPVKGFVYCLHTEVFHRCTFFETI